MGCCYRLVLAILLLSACGCGDDGSTDGGGGDGGGDSGTDVGRVDPPAAPDFGACPEGFRSLELEPGVMGCDPWPASGMATCKAEDEAHFVGEPGCVVVGSACPAGDFPEGLPAGATVLFVRAGAPAGGDGSMGSPFDSVRTAALAAASGDIIAVGKGSYDEVVQLRAGVTLWGACTGETRIAATFASDSTGTISVEGADAVIRNVSIGGERPGVTVSRAGASVDLIDVVISTARAFGLLVENGGGATGSGLVVRDTRSDSMRTFGNGIYVGSGGSVDLERIALLRNRAMNLNVTGAGTRAVVRRAAIRAVVQHEIDRFPGFCVSATLGATLEISASAIEEGGFLGIQAVCVRLPTPPDPPEPCVDRTTITVRDSVVRDTVSPRAPDPTGLGGGNGIGIVTGAGATIERVLVERNMAAGLVVLGEGSSLVGTDVVVRDHLPSTDGRTGWGLAAGLQASVELTRAILARNLASAAHVELGASMRLVDTAIVDTRSDMMESRWGWGIEAEQGAAVELLRTEIRGNRGIGISAVDLGTTLTAEHVRVADTASDAFDGRAGYGIQAGLGATATVEAGAFERNRGISILVAEPGASLELTDVRVDDTALEECAMTGCADPFGYAASTFNGARLTVNDFAIRRSPEVAVQVAGGGEADLHRGEVAESPIGFNIQTVGFDEMRLRDGVVLTGVGVAVDLSGIAVPTLVPPIGM